MVATPMAAPERVKGPAVADMVNNSVIGRRRQRVVRLHTSAKSHWRVFRLGDELIKDGAHVGPTTERGEDEFTVAGFVVR